MQTEKFEFFIDKKVTLILYYIRKTENSPRLLSYQTSSKENVSQIKLN